MVLEHLQRPDFTLEVCAEWLRTDLPSLCAFLTSDRGLTLLAETELAQAIHIRAIAIAQLPRVIDAMTHAHEDFANTCRNVPLNPKSMPALEFVERAKDTARKSGQLLLRLAHFTPRPLRSYAPPIGDTSTRLREVAGEDRLANGQAGERNKAHLKADALHSTAAPSPTNPTRERGGTATPIAPPNSQSQQLSSPPLPALTSPEREQVGASISVPTSTSADRSQPKPPARSILVPLTISARKRSHSDCAPTRRTIKSSTVSIAPATGPPDRAAHPCCHN